MIELPKTAETIAAADALIARSATMSEAEFLAEARALLPAMRAANDEMAAAALDAVLTPSSRDVLKRLDAGKGPGQGRANTTRFLSRLKLIERGPDGRWRRT